MARLLYPRDSAKFILNGCRRHVRFCQQNPLGAPYILPIQTPVKVLQTKEDLLEDAKTHREDTYDDVMLGDFDLDTTIKSTSETSKAYMLKHSTDLKVQQLFPNGYSEITKTPYALEPDKADAVASMIESFGTEHELFPLAAEIRKETANVRAKIVTMKEAIRLQKAAEAEVEIAKLDVIRAYEANYLNARLQLGVMAAERLFPVLTPEKEEEEKPKKDQ